MLWLTRHVLVLQTAYGGRKDDYWRELVIKSRGPNIWRRCGCKTVEPSQDWIANTSRPVKANNYWWKTKKAHREDWFLDSCWHKCDNRLCLHNHRTCPIRWLYRRHFRDQQIQRGPLKQINGWWNGIKEVWIKDFRHRYEKEETQAKWYLITVMIITVTL